MKFYQPRDVSAQYGTPVTLQAEPWNEHDALCVAAWILPARISDAIDAGTPS